MIRTTSESRAPIGTHGIDWRATLVALAVLLGVELGVVRSGYVWKRAPHSMVGAFYGVETEILAKAPPPAIVFMGSSRTRDGVDPRQVEAVLGLPHGGVLNLGFTGGTPFEARLFYERNRSLLKHARVVVLGVEDWYWNDGFPRDEVERQFVPMGTRWRWFEQRRQLGDLVGGAWRTVEMEDPLGRLVMSFVKGVKPLRFEDDRMVWRLPADVRDVGPTKVDVAGVLEHGMQAYRLGRGYEVDIRALIAAARADGVRVILTQVPLRGTYCDERELRHPDLAPYVRARVEALANEGGVDTALFDRAAALGIPDDRFYDYGHLTRDGARRMAAVWGELVRPFL